MASTMAEALRGEQPLLKEIFGKDDMRAAQDQIKGMLKSVTDRTAMNATAAESRHRRDLGRTGRALGQGRHRPTRLPFAPCFAGIGNKVANASSEGGFLGSGGERVSNSEQIEFLSSTRRTR